MVLVEVAMVGVGVVFRSGGILCEGGVGYGGGDAEL